MLISIITINFNDLQGLKKTMTSVLGQTYTGIEYIVIDGGSTDGSKEYLETHQDSLSYWVSEPDKGIYNAMNKGIDQATGDYLLFLNSGDSFNNNEVLDRFVEYKPIEDIVYGDSVFIYQNKESKLKKMPSYLEGMTVFYRTLNHQAVFHNKRIFDKGKRYNETYKMLADWVLYNEVILFDGGSYRHIDMVIVNYDANGFSSKPENAAIMQKDREKFYFDNSTFFIPHILENYDIQKHKNKRKKSKGINRFLHASKLLKKSIRVLVKGY